MGVSLVVVDHHPLNIDFSRENIKTIKAKDLQDFYKKVRYYLGKEYDLVISDEDPDGMTSVILYSLFKGKVVNFKGNRTGLKKEDVRKLESEGIEKIVSFDWFPLSFSDLDAFDNIIYLNPRNSGLVNVNTSEIVFRALPETGRFGRDISAIGTVCDYLVDTSQEKMREVIEDYPELFPELLQLAGEGKLDRYNIYSTEVNNTSFQGLKVNTKFYDLSLMFWAPFIMEGDAGNKRLVELAVNNPNFTLTDLINGSNNPVVQYVRPLYNKLQELVTNERNNFYITRRVQGRISFYEPKEHRSGLMSKVSSILCDELPAGDIIAMKSRSQENGLEIFRYSLRGRNGSKYNLGKILTELNVGGGHENAAGAKVQIEKVEWFENELVSRTSQ